MGDDIGMISLSQLIMHPKEFRMEMESALEDAVVTAEDMIVRVQMLEPERIVGQYCQSINNTATESAKTVKTVITRFSRILNNVLETEVDATGHNPLMIDLILRNVFVRLTLTDLKTSRLVCKLWNEEAGSYVRRNHRVMFSPNSVDKMHSFSLFMSTHRETGYSNFSFTAQYPISRWIIHDFSAVYGSYVRNLEMFYPNNGCLSSCHFKVFLSRLPNVEHIHFVNLPSGLTRGGFLDPCDDLELASLTSVKIDRTLLVEGAWSREFLQHLFKVIPNLKHYELWTWNSTDEHSQPYFNCLSDAQRGNLVSLYPGSIGTASLERLSGFRNLSKLHLPVLNVCAQNLEAMISSLRTSLRELLLNCSCMKDSRMITFPIMDNLEILHMVISMPWKSVCMYTPSIEYQTQFPVLRSLKLELAIYHDFGYVNYFFPTNRTVCNSLTNLDISFSGYRDDKFIGTVAQIFPNLVKLRLDGYGNRILAGICLYLQNLEYFEMYLIYGFNVDDQLTGIDRKVCNGFKASRLAEFADAQTLPSLASFHKLKVLKIKQKDYQAKYWPDAQCITDITGYFALAKIATLRHLHIDSVKFSPECRQYLATNLQDCWLDIL